MEPKKTRHRGASVALAATASKSRKPLRRWLDLGRLWLLALALAPLAAHAGRSSERDLGLYASLSHAYADIALAKGQIQDASGIRSALCVTMGKYAGIEYSEHHLRDDDLSATLSTVSLVAEIPATRQWQILLRYGLGKLYRDKRDGATDDDARGLLQILPPVSSVPVYGIGTQFDWRGGWRLRGELEAFTTMVDGQRHRGNLSLSLGLVYQFF